MRVTRDWNHDETTAEVADAVVRAVTDVDVRWNSDEGGTVVVRTDDGRRFRLVLEEVL